MNNNVKFALAAALAAPTAAMLSMAGVARAQPPLLNGAYTITGGDAEMAWTVNTSCAADVCTGQFTSSRGWVSNAKLVDGLWVFVISKPDGATCADGSQVPAEIGVSVNPATMVGVISTDSNFACPGGLVTNAPFTLRPVG